ncbi:MAG: glycosyltransferase family 2 protein [Fibrobacter sp.]|nr:glycosyltransferase family 2 protein [Fibrobacter sp.]
MIHAFFWGSLFLIFFSYLGYPVSLGIIRFFRKNELKRKLITPFVSFIITAYNEENKIREKLDNTLQTNYPRELLQIIVASDGSTDRTNDIVRSYSAYNINLIELPEHMGKEAAQVQAIKAATGEILIFSDTATRIDPESISNIVSNFSDPTVGCVSSEDRIISSVNGQTVSGEGLYVRYEMWLRRIESSINSVVGLSGSFFAARRSVCADLTSLFQSDFKILLNTVKKGMRGISDPTSVGLYSDLSDTSREFNRKVRTVLRGLTVFFSNIEFLDFFRYGFFSYQFICHKLLRWMAPLFLVGSFLGSMLLSFSSSFYFYIFITQFFFYLSAIAVLVKPSLIRVPLFKVALFFVQVNISIAVAWYKYIRGDRIVSWQPSVR